MTLASQSAGGVSRIGPRQSRYRSRPDYEGVFSVSRFDAGN